MTEENINVGKMIFRNVYYNERKYKKGVMKTFSKVIIFYSFLLCLFPPVNFSQESNIVNGWELLPPQTYDVSNTFSRLENGYQTFKTSGTTYAFGGEFDQITNYRKNFSNIISSGNKKTPKFFGFDYKISELVGDITAVQIGLAVLDDHTYIYNSNMSEKIENPIVDGWKKVRFSTEKIIGMVPTFNRLEFMFWGISNKVGYISISISIDNLFGEDSLGVQTIYDGFDISDVPRGNSLPIKFSLSQNYPNPFNPVTTIRYSIPTSSHVSLKVYDLLGREVAELVNEYKITGDYEVQFNASNLPSGVYMYKLQSSSFSVSKKMLLMK